MKRVLKYAPIRSDFVTVDSSVAGYDERAETVTTDYVMNDDGTVIDAETGAVVADNAVSE